MAKMLFAKTVKYLGIEYPSNTQFTVQDEDVLDLKTAGGWVVGKDPTKKVVVAVVAEDDFSLEEEDHTDVKPTEDDEVKSELQVLRAKALDLGIDFKGNWGTKKLAAAIEEAEIGEED